MVHRQEFHRVDTQALEMLGDGRIGHASEPSPQVLGNRGMQLSESLDMRLVDHALLKRTPFGNRLGGRTVGDHHGQRNGAGRIAGVGFEVRAGNVIENGSGVVDARRNRTGIGVDEELGGVGPQPLIGVPLGMYAEAITLACHHIGHEDRPGTSAQGHVDIALGGAIAINQRELNSLGSGCPQPEMAAICRQMGSQHVCGIGTVDLSHPGVLPTRHPVGGVCFRCVTVFAATRRGATGAAHA